MTYWTRHLFGNTLCIG